MAPDALHVAIVLSPFILLPIAGWLGMRGTKRARLLALIPATLTGYFVWAFWRVGANGPFTVTVPWASSLGLSLSFHFDGLGVFFATLIAAVGTLIVLYAAEYLRGHNDAGQFHISLLAFMGSMLGLVLADNLIAVRVLGTHGFHLVLVDRIRARPIGGAARSLTGLDRHGSWWPCSPGRRDIALGSRWYH